MKKIILAIAAILFMGELTATAQTRTTVSINGMKGSDLESIDSTKYRITYEGKWVNNPSIKPYIYTESEMRLDIGNKVTYFYDRTKQLKDSLMRERRPRQATSTSPTFQREDAFLSPITRTILPPGNPPT